VLVGGKPGPVRSWSPPESVKALLLGTERLIYKTTDGEAPSTAMENDKLNILKSESLKRRGKGPGGKLLTW